MASVRVARQARKIRAGAFVIVRSGFRTWEDLRAYLRSLSDDLLRETVSRALLAGEPDDIDLLDEMIAHARGSHYARIDAAIERLHASGLLRDPR